MTRGEVVRRRATYGMVAAMLGTVLIAVVQGVMLRFFDGGSSLFRWTGWWTVVFDIVIFTGLVGFARYPSNDRSKLVAYVGVVFSAVVVLNVEITELLFVVFPSSYVPFHLSNGARMLTAGLVVGLFWLDETLGEDDALSKLIKSTAFVLPGIWIFTWRTSGLTGLMSLEVSLPLAIVAGALTIICVRKLRKRDELPGVDTELGVELVWLTIVWRVALAVVASVSAAFIWTPDVYSAAGLSSALGILAVPAAFGASQMAEQIVRETTAMFRRASILWWLASGLWIAQVAWLYIMGSGLGTFIPSVAAVIVEVFAWHTYRQALADWSRNEGDEQRASLSDAPKMAIFAAGGVFVTAFVTAFFSADYAVWVVAVGGLLAAVGAYQLSIAIRSMHQDVLSATYIES